MKKIILILIFINLSLIIVGCNDFDSENKEIVYGISVLSDMNESDYKGRTYVEIGDSFTLTATKWYLNQNRVKKNGETIEAIWGIEKGENIGYFISEKGKSVTFVVEGKGEFEIFMKPIESDTVVYEKFLAVEWGDDDYPW